MSTDNFSAEDFDFDAWLDSLVNEAMGGSNLPPCKPKTLHTYHIVRKLDNEIVDEGDVDATDKIHATFLYGIEHGAEMMSLVNEFNKDTFVHNTLHHTTLEITLIG